MADGDEAIVPHTQTDTKARWYVPDGAMKIEAKRASNIRKIKSYFVLMFAMFGKT